MILEREETEETIRSASKSPHGGGAGELLRSCGGVPPATASVPSHRACTGRSVYTPVCHFMVKVCPLLPDRQTPGTLKAKVLESLKRKGKVEGEKVNLTTLL